MICCGLDPECIRNTIREGFEVLKGCIVDVYTKNITTVQGHPDTAEEAKLEAVLPMVAEHHRKENIT